ncbi:MAG: hypothetical protein IRY92_02245 [Dactylosporangium sp.]|nr:hypothetical protein [Dactylosporangium sp.]
MHERIASDYAPSQDLPCADSALLAPLRRSPEFAAIAERVVGDGPVDTWQEDDLHFFVFRLGPEEDAPATPEPPVAVFVMAPGQTEPVSAVTVTPTAEGDAAEVVDIRDPDSGYTAPYAP